MICIDVSSGYLVEPATKTLPLMKGGVVMKIIFNADSTLYKCGESAGIMAYNSTVVKSMLRYFENLYLARGYLYTNEVYEHLCLSWDPTKENTCFIYERDGALLLDYTFEKELSGFEIVIEPRKK